jgi:hypothetical protein
MLSVWCRSWRLVLKITVPEERQLGRSRNRIQNVYGHVCSIFLSNTAWKRYKINDNDQIDEANFTRSA